MKFELLDFTDDDLNNDDALDELVDEFLDSLLDGDNLPDNEHKKSGGTG